MHTKYWLGNLRRRAHLGDICRWRIIKDLKEVGCELNSPGSRRDSAASFCECDGTYSVSINDEECLYQLLIYQLIKKDFSQWDY
jgi:hypothetical protein